MKILIGTPIHEVKDYSMKRWLANVAELRKMSPSDFLMVDNSPNTEYVERVKSYCSKCRIKNFKIMHIKINRKVEGYLRIEVTQEIIRRYVLFHKYDIWFSWECDQLIPKDSLIKLIEIMKSGHYMMVIHNTWARWNINGLNTDMGCTLIDKKCLRNYWTCFERNDGFNLNNPKSNIITFKEGVLLAGGNYAEVFGVIHPIYHLKE